MDARTCMVNTRATFHELTLPLNAAESFAHTPAPDQPSETASPRVVAVIPRRASKAAGVERGFNSSAGVEGGFRPSLATWSEIAHPKRRLPLGRRLGAG